MKIKRPTWLSTTRTNTIFSSVSLASILSRFNVSALPPVLEEVRKILPSEAFVAGGFLTEALLGLMLKDIDVWFTSESALNEFLVALREAVTKEPLKQYGFQEIVNPASGTSSFIAPGKHTPISLNSYYLFTGPEHIIDSFDFTIVQTALTRSSQVYVGPTTLDDIENKRLAFHRPQNTIYNRAKRYLEKGFIPTEEAWLTIEQLAPRLAEEIQIFKNFAQAQAGFANSPVPKI